MSDFGNVAFDPETLAILEGVFDEAWASIQAQRNGNITRAALAERFAAQLENDSFIDWRWSFVRHGPVIFNRTSSDWEVKNHARRKGP